MIRMSWGPETSWRRSYWSTKDLTARQNLRKNLSCKFMYLPSYELRWVDAERSPLCFIVAVQNKISLHSFTMTESQGHPVPVPPYTQSYKPPIIQLCPWGGRGGTFLPDPWGGSQIFPGSTIPGVMWASSYILCIHLLLNTLLSWRRPIPDHTIHARWGVLCIMYTLLHCATHIPIYCIELNGMTFCNILIPFKKREPVWSLVAIPM